MHPFGVVCIIIHTQTHRHTQKSIHPVMLTLLSQRCQKGQFMKRKLNDTFSSYTWKQMTKWGTKRAGHQLLSSDNINWHNWQTKHLNRLFDRKKKPVEGLDQSRDKFHFINLDSVVGRGHPSHNRQAVLDRPRCLFHPKMDLLPKHLSTHLSHRWIRVHQSDREGRKKKADGKRERACRVNNGDVLKHLLSNVRVGPIDRPNRLPVLSTWIKEMIKRQIEEEETHTQVDNGILREDKKRDIYIKIKIEI